MPAAAGGGRVVRRGTGRNTAAAAAAAASGGTATATSGSGSGGGSGSGSGGVGSAVGLLRRSQQRAAFDARRATAATIATDFLGSDRKEAARKLKEAKEATAAARAAAALAEGRAEAAEAKAAAAEAKAAAAEARAQALQQQLDKALSADVQPAISELKRDLGQVASLVRQSSQLIDERVKEPVKTPKASPEPEKSPAAAAAGGGVQGLVIGEEVEERFSEVLEAVAGVDEQVNKVAADLLTTQHATSQVMLNAMGGMIAMLKDGVPGGVGAGVAGAAGPDSGASGLKEAVLVAQLGVLEEKLRIAEDEARTAVAAQLVGEAEMDRLRKLENELTHPSKPVEPQASIAQLAAAAESNRQAWLDQTSRYNNLFQQWRCLKASNEALTQRLQRVVHAGGVDSSEGAAVAALSHVQAAIAAFRAKETTLPSTM